MMIVDPTNTVIGIIRSATRCNGVGFQLVIGEINAPQYEEISDKATSKIIKDVTQMAKSSIFKNILESADNVLPAKDMVDLKKAVADTKANIDKLADQLKLASTKNESLHDGFKKSAEKLDGSVTN